MAAPLQRVDAPETKVSAAVYARTLAGQADIIEVSRTAGFSGRTVYRQ